MKLSCLGCIFVQVVDQRRATPGGNEIEKEKKREKMASGPFGTSLSFGVVGEEFFFYVFYSRERTNLKRRL
ncbi:MAG: hypothetical protein ACE5FU_14025, partial [Nitrospinota bacterium]